MLAVMTTVSVGCRPVREIAVVNNWIANFQFFFYEIYFENQQGHKTLRFKCNECKRLWWSRHSLLVRMEYIFAFQI